jgi:hypothetical protein
MTTMSDNRLQALSGLLTTMRLPRWARGPANWPARAAGLLAALLLTVFVQTVVAHVRESESRKRAHAAQLDRLWRCNLLQTVPQRASCRANVHVDGLSVVETSP